MTALSGLRKPDNRSTTLSMAIRRARPGKSWLAKGLLDPLSATASLTEGRAVAELSDIQTSNYTVNLGYLLQSQRKGMRLPLGGIVKVLPKFMREGQLGKGLARADLSLKPTRVRLGSGLSRDEVEFHGVPVSRGAD